MCVTHEKRSYIHQHPAVLLGGGLESPKHRLGERILDGALLGRIVAAGAISEIDFLEKHPRTHPLEFDNAALAELTAIESDVARSHTGRERVEKEKLGVPERNLQPEFSFTFIPVEGEISVELPKQLCLIGDCWQWFVVFVGFRERGN